MEGDAGIAVTDVTPFYGESGGQVGDTGAIMGPDGILDVNDTQKLPNGVFLHYFTCKRGLVERSTSVTMLVDENRRMDIRRNHSATHLLHHALREVLGEHVHQAGSYVAPDQLRFDFSHVAPVTDEELLQIQRIANSMVLSDYQTHTDITTKDEAVAHGAMALFGEKYGEKVRMVTMGDSVELCGGTHCDSTGQIGFIRITNESGIGSGLRRIEAVTGMHSYNWMMEKAEMLFRLSKEIKVPWGDLLDKVLSLQREARNKDKRCV